MWACRMKTLQTKLVTQNERQSLISLSARAPNGPHCPSKGLDMSRLKLSKWFVVRPAARTVQTFLDSWTTAVSVGWVFGIATFLSVGLFPCIHYVVNVKEPRAPAV